MKELSVQAQNDIIKLHDGSAWAELLDLRLPDGYAPSAEFARYVSTSSSDGKHVLLTNAGRNVMDDSADVWQAPDFPAGKIYLCTPYKREELAEMQGTDGAHTMNISMGDTSDTLWNFSQTLDGFRGLTVTLSIAQVKDEDDNFIHVFPPEIAVDYTVRYTATDRTNFTFSLSTNAPFGRQYPQRRMFKTQCRWVFKSPECGYRGSASSCAHTIAACQSLSNITRIGCFPGCGTGGLAQ